MAQTLAKAALAKVQPIAQNFVTLTQFGAIGGLNANYPQLPDDTNAIQAAINYCKSTGATLHVDSRFYRFTKSLNWGKSNAKDGIIIKVVGDNRSRCQFVADLSEPYPAHDFTNQGRGQFSNITFTSTTTSQHTCLALLAETSSSGANLISINDCEFVDLGATSAYAIFGLTADQCMINNTNVNASGGAAVAAVRFDNTNPNAIASKYYSIVAFDADCTLLEGNYCNFMCPTGPALWVRAYGSVNMFSAYGGVVGTTGHSAGIIRIASGTSLINGTPRICSVTMIGLRTEHNVVPPQTPTVVVTGSIAPSTDNMTSVLTVTDTTTGTLAVGHVLTGTGIAAGTVVLAQLTASTWQVSNIQTVTSTTVSTYQMAPPCVYVEDAIYESIIQGHLNGYGAFGGPGSHNNSQVAIVYTYGAFSNAGPLIGGKFHFSGGNNSGGSFDQVNSRQYEIGGRIGASYSSILPAYAPSAGRFSDLSADTSIVDMPFTRGDLRVFFPIANTPRNYRVAVQGESGLFNTNTYTGGSGLVKVFAQVFSPACMVWLQQNNTDLVLPAHEIVLEGQFNSNWAAGGQMTIALEQALTTGAKYSTLVNLTNIPAYGAVTGWRAVLSMYRTTGSPGVQSWYVLGKIETFGSAPVSNIGNLNLAALGYDYTAAQPLVVDGLISNSGSSPLAPAVGYKLV